MVLLITGNGVETTMLLVPGLEEVTIDLQDSTKLFKVLS